MQKTIPSNFVPTKALLKAVESHLTQLSCITVFINQRPDLSIQMADIKCMFQGSLYPLYSSWRCGKTSIFKNYNEDKTNFLMDRELSNGLQ